MKYKKKRKKTAAATSPANDFHHYTISSGDTVYPSTWTCQLKELGCGCDGQQPADCEFEHRSSVSFHQNSTGESACLALTKQQMIFIVLISHLGKLMSLSQVVLRLGDKV